jgi:uncharacterized membrane protein YphA (DoxX/SURF4 family)
VSAGKSRAASGPTRRTQPGRAAPAAPGKTRVRQDRRAAGDVAVGTSPAARPSLTEGVPRIAGEWAPTIARVLLGLVLAWFGYHELVQPSLWTGYVPVVSATSTAAIVLVLAHGWLLLVLAVAVIAGIATRVAAAVAALLLLEIVISLWVTAGLSDLTLRDVGVLGLAVLLTAPSQQRLVLSR